MAPFFLITLLVPILACKIASLPILFIVIPPFAASLVVSYNVGLIHVAFKLSDSVSKLVFNSLTALLVFAKSLLGEQQLNILNQSLEPYRENLYGSFNIEGGGDNDLV